MVKKYSRLGKEASRYLLIATMTGALVGCGGSSSSDGPLGDQDADEDGIINSQDTDADGDGILDTADALVDVDGDGIDDSLKLADLDSDGIINADDDDADGDGTLDYEDPFVDLDNDGLDDITLLTEAEATGSTGDGFVAVSDTTPCGSESGTDNSSANNAWNDNCTVKRFGQFADSLFTVGIQRVLYCSGFGTASSYTVFADGEVGSGTDTQIKAFQAAESLTDDGIVGPATWAALQSRVELLAEGTAGNDGTGIDTYGFSTGACAGIPMFYQDFTVTQAGLVLGGWTLARNQPNDAESVPFSYEEPFGKL